MNDRNPILFSLDLFTFYKGLQLIQYIQTQNERFATFERLATHIFM